METFDMAILDHLKVLNEMGLETFASCSGHPWDKASYPYIAFTNYVEVFAELARWNGFNVMDNRNAEVGWKLAMHHNIPADTEGFVSKLDCLITQYKALEHLKHNGLIVIK